MTHLSKTQAEKLLNVLRDLEETIENARILTQYDDFKHDDCPARAHALMKAAIQRGSEPMVIGNFAMVRL